jgi:glycosyltransferase involved in cell wall biosynthesis
LLGIPGDRPVVLSVGHLTERKGFHVLIDAIGRLRRQRPDLLLVIVGEGVYRSKLEAQIRSNGLEASVRLVGAQAHDQLSSWYSAADLFCLASSREGWANVILEAMACGLPVIATNVWGTPEVVSSPALGTLVERDAVAFETAISDGIARSWDRNAIITHARSHGWASVATRQLAVYTRVITARGTRNAK